MQGPQLASHRNGYDLDLPELIRATKEEDVKGDEPSSVSNPVETSARNQTTSNERVGTDGGRTQYGSGSRNRRWRPRKTTIDSIKRKVIAHTKFIGPGIIASVAYIDPGNWATDLQAGSQYGYSHLFIILLSGLIALLFQVLATRLGCVSDLDLSAHCRRALYDRPKYTMLCRWGLLYPLYALAEIGIIFTDLAELLGSAIAINLLIPAIPLWAAVLLTSTDVFLILLLFNQYPTRIITRSMRIFELLIGLLVVTVLGTFVALLVKVSPVWKDAFHGYVPGPGIIENGALYIAVGIIGATVMPHAFFIGSKMATMRRLQPEEYDEDFEDVNFEDKAKNGAIELQNTRTSPRVEASRGGPHLHLPQPFALGNYDLNSSTRRASVSAAADQIVKTNSRTEKAVEGEVDDRKSSEPALMIKPTLACVQAHLGHAVADIMGSLLGFATVINSAILIVAAAVFYYGEGRAAVGDEGVSDLFDAFDLIAQYLGKAFAYLFAIGLFMAGQSASLTVTLSGQIVSEGFIEWRTKPWKRRLITRLIGIVPSLAVAVAVGRQGISVLLVGSQVALSIVLTFVLVPLIIFTSQKDIMSIPIIPDASNNFLPTPKKPVLAPSPRSYWKLNPFRRRKAPEGFVSFASPMFIIWLCWALWLLITIANVFALYDIKGGSG